METVKGSADKFTDIAFDAQYQYIVKKHVLSAQTTFIHENQNWDASYALGDTANKSDHLNTFRINLNYYYRSYLGQIGGTVGYFSTTGSKDDMIYSPGPLDGSRTGKPDSDGFILEADFLPWRTGKISLQYTIYNNSTAVMRTMTAPGGMPRITIHSICSSGSCSEDRSLRR